MGFSLYNLFIAGLLLVNAIAILHPKRFLSKYSLDRVDPNEHSSPLKSQVVGLLQAIGYLKVPLIAMNSLIILVEILIGG